MDNRIRQILNAYTSKRSTNTDLYLNVNFDSNQKLLPPEQINYVLDINTQFNTERQNSTFYRILGKLNPVISNVLFNITGNNSWEIFSGPTFTTTSIDSTVVTLSYSESIKKQLKEIEGWYGYFDPVLTHSALCNYFDMEPTRERFSFLPDYNNSNNIGIKIKNWELMITYPYAADTIHPLIKNGLMIVYKQPVIVGGKNMTALFVPVSHNLNIDDSIVLSGTNMDDTYTVKRVGLDDGTLQNNYFCIDVDESDLQIAQDSRFSKMYNEVQSQYYFRRFKKIKTRATAEIEPDDYEIYDLGFSENIFADEITQFIFNEDIDVSDLTDNLGRPLSELYLTTIKTNSNGIFSQTSSGIEVPFVAEFNTANINGFLKRVPVIQKIHNVVLAESETFTPLESNVNVNNSDFYGDVVEYNSTTIQEVILASVNYRFNTLNRESVNGTIAFGPRPEGYYYQAHQLIRIRNFSSYIEQGDNSTAGMPDYKVELSDGTFIWRDLLPIGENDLQKGTLNYPFLNGCHYMYDNYCFDVKRQDPFDNWNLFCRQFPSDPVGVNMPNNFTVNKVINVC